MRSKTEELELIAREMETSTYPPETMAACLYSAVKVLTRKNTFTDVGRQLLRAADANLARWKEAGNE